MNNELHQQLKDIIHGLLHEVGVELFEFKVNRHKKSVFIRILVDWPLGGITIEQCAQLNRTIQQRIDAGGLLEVPYSLELSSPGVDRPLRTKRDFLRVVNHNVHIFLYPMDHLKGEYIGILKQVNDQEVVIISSGREVRIPFGMIIKAQQDI